MVPLYCKRWFTALTIGAALCAGAAQAEALKEGDQAPAFKVMSTTGKPIALSDYLGNKAVVLFIYYAAFTGT